MLMFSFCKPRVHISSRGLKQLLFDHCDIFAKDSTDLGFGDIRKHDNDTGDSRPTKQSPGRPTLAARDTENEILNEMIQSGVIEPSVSSWPSPVCRVPKNDGTYRFCTDYRRVNAASKKTHSSFLIFKTPLTISEA